MKNDNYLLTSINKNSNINTLGIEICYSMGDFY